MPRVSVVIPTFNCERFIGRTVDSALRQTYRDFEVIVVDDGSTDGTPAVLARYGEALHCIKQENQGASAARNTALTNATGEFIAYLDADDLWDPQKLARQVAYLDANPACGFVHTEVAVIDEQDMVLHARFNQETRRRVPQGRCLKDILQRSHIQTLTVLERRSAFERAGMFDLRLPVAQDYLHWIQVVLQGYEVGYVPDPLGQYRWRAGSLMSSQRRLLGDFTKIYEILLNEYGLEGAHGVEIQRLVATQLYANQRQLAYLERLECSGAVARQRLRHLVRQWPFRLELYMDLAKSYLGHRKLQTPVNPS
ncbi:MAG: glycosyltransferase [Nitrospira sp. CR1.1]|jgi:GT2 family glycosyltransferase|nr:glycosyltransferase [Nitrospira sp. CR1.1]